MNLLRNWWKRVAGLPLLGPAKVQMDGHRIVDAAAGKDFILEVTGNGSRLEDYLRSSVDGEEIRALLYLTGAEVLVIHSSSRAYVRFLIEYPVPGREKCISRMIDDPVNIQGWQSRLTEMAITAEEHKT